MIRRPPRSTQSRSSAASDVYKRQRPTHARFSACAEGQRRAARAPVSYTHLRAHETRHDLVCRLLLEKKKTMTYPAEIQSTTPQEKNRITSYERNVNTTET